MTETTKSNVLDRLTEGITQLTSSDRWQDWLNMQSRFHHYSFNNTLLIMKQRPDATRVAGYNAWRKLDRFVRKGEKGIWILAPMIYKSDTGDESGEDSTKRVLRGFKPVPVFDLSQTDGQELPEICNRLEGDDDGNLFGRLRTVATTLGFSVEDTDELAEGVNGDCNYRLHCIRVRASNSPMQRVKTLAHELGHALLHEHNDDRPLGELEAESVAFIVCANSGINSDDYSFGYVAHWSGGSDEALAAIRASGTRIQQAADRILTAMSGEELVGGGVMAYTIDDIVELANYHLVAAADNDKIADHNLAQLMRKVEKMIVSPTKYQLVYWMACEECGAWVSSELIGPDGAGKDNDGGFYCTSCRFGEEL